MILEPLPRAQGLALEFKGAPNSRGLTIELTAFAILARL